MFEVLWCCEVGWGCFVVRGECCEVKWKCFEVWSVPFQLSWQIFKLEGQFSELSWLPRKLSYPGRIVMAILQTIRAIPRIVMACVKTVMANPRHQGKSFSLGKTQDGIPGNKTKGPFFSRGLLTYLNKIECFILFTGQLRQVIEWDPSVAINGSVVFTIAIDTMFPWGKHLAGVD